MDSDSDSKFGRLTADDVDLFKHQIEHISDSNEGGDIKDSSIGNAASEIDNFKVKG